MKNNNENENKIPNREEIPLESRWDIQSLYSSLEEWEEDCQRTKKLADELLKYKDSFTEEATSFIKCLQSRDKILDLAHQVYTYAHMRKDEDNNDTQNQSIYNKASSLLVEIEDSLSFIQPGILSLNAKTIGKWIAENEQLKIYQHHLQGIFRKKKHILSPEKEKIIAQAGEMSMIPENTFGLLSNADLKFPSVKNHNGEYIAISQGNFVSLLRNKDRNFRKRVFRKYYQQYFLHRHTFASLLTGKLKKDRFFNKVRKYKNSLSAALFEDNIPIAVYDNLINIAHKNVSLLQKYIQLKKERLGYKNFYMYDMYTALSEKTDRIEYSKAQELILAALQPLGSEYLEIVKKAFKERWIDVYENKGKSSGAYSTGSYKSKPYILLNYQGTMEDVFTLAHELGHSLHSFYTNKEQPFIYSGYPIFLAEIASTTNEALLINYIIKNNAESKKDTLLILNNFLEQFRTTFFRQTMFAEFEKIIHQYEEKGGSLTAEWYSQQYADLIYKYYGNSVVIDKEIHMEWARIPHFYYDFYVYKYSTGFASAIALSRRILQEGKTAVDEYLRFLGKGSSEYPITILKQTGVDMISLNPLTEAMNLFAELLEQLESI